MRCPECGFDPSSVSPADAIVALRSYPRRYRELAGEPVGERDDAERWAAVVTAAGSAALAIEDLTADLSTVFVGDEPVLGTDENVATMLRNPGDTETALDRLSAASARMADLTAAHHGTEWSRRGVRSSGPVSALDLLRDAVHAGIHHLRKAEADLT